MKKSQRLKTIVDLNADSEKKALEELGKIQAKKQNVETQLKNLQQYRSNYQQQYQTVSEKGVNIAQLLEFRAFIHKLDIAIEGQQTTMDHLDGELSFARKNWEHKHQKTQSLQKVYDSAVSEEQRWEQKKEQKEQDERAMRTGRNSGTGNA